MDAAVAEDYPSPLRRWTAVTLLMIAVQLSFTDRLIINLFVDDIRSAMALTELAMSLVLGGGFAIIYALAGIPAGRAADRRNRRTIIVGGVLIWSIATMGCGIADSFGELFWARILVGLGEATLLPAAASLIADSFPLYQRGRALGLFLIGGVLGSGIAFGVGGALLDWIAAGGISAVPLLGTLSGWRTVIILAGLPGLPLALLLLALVREPSRKGRMGTTPTLAAVMRAVRIDNGRVLRICLAVGLIAAGDYGIMSWLPTVLARDHGMTTSDIGYLLALVISLAGIAGCLGGGWLSDLLAARHGAPARLHVMLGSYGLCMASAALFLLPSVAGKVVAIVLWFLGSVAGGVVGYAVLQEAVPNEMRGTVTALSYMSSAIIGIGGGPLLVVVFGHVSGGGMTIGLASLCFACAAAGVAALFGTASRPRAPELA